MLLKKGAGLQLHDNDGRTPLHLACYKGHTKVAKLLIDKGADLQSVDKWGRTPLHWAAKYGKLNVAKLLIECGANMRCKDQWGLTALQWACINGHMELASVLSESGADMSSETESSDAKGGDRQPREWQLTTTPQQLQEEVRLRKAAERKAVELEGSLAEAEAVVIELGETIDARVAEERAAADQLRLQLDIALNRAAQLQIQLSEVERHRTVSEEVSPAARYSGAEAHADAHGENGAGIGNKTTHKLHVLLDKLQESERRRADVEQQVSRIEG